MDDNGIGRVRGQPIKASEELKANLQNILIISFGKVPKVFDIIGEPRK